MSPIARDLDVKFDYILKAEHNKKGVPDVGATVFRLKVLSQKERARIEDEAVFAVADKRGGGHRIHTRTGATEIALLHAGVMSWTDFRDSEGNEVPCAEPSELASLADRLSAEDRHELCAAIERGSAASPSEGNS